MWLLALAANTIIAGAYFAISAAILGGLRRTGQLGRANALGTATAAIFFTCGGGHLIHAVHLAEPWVGLGSELARETADWHLGIWDAATAVVAVTYWTLRGSYGRLLAGAEIFSDNERRRMEEEIRRTGDLFRTAFEEAPIGKALIAPDGTFLRVNSAFAGIAGEPVHALIGRHHRALAHPADAAADEARFDALLAGGAERHVATERYLRADGTQVPVQVTASLVRHPSGEPRYVIAQIEDLSARVAAEAERDAARERFERAFQAAPVGIALVTRGRVTRANHFLQELTGRSMDREPELADLVVPEAREAIEAAFAELACGAPRVELESRVASARSEPWWAVISAAPLDRGDGNAVVHVVDITERKRFEHRLRHMADHDPLTGLFNRRRFDAELDRALAHARRYRHSGAVMVLDLDGFKYVNDALGHTAGDELMLRVGVALVEALRATDVLARIGGDEFGVILPHASAEEAGGVADKVLAMVARQARLDGPDRHARVTTSIGITTYSAEEGLTAEDLLAEADIAMYDAKDAGRNTWQLFRTGERRRERLTLRTRWMQRLRSAVEDDRLALVAQPIVGVASNGRARFELLLRYRDDDGNLVAPGVWLYIAERFDLVPEIDRWVLRQAVDLLEHEHIAGRELVVSVNLSARTMADPGLADFMDALLEDRAVPRGRLVVELTETAAITNIDRAREFAARLHRLGCELALDDFGAGFASFYYLKHLDFDYVKVDGEFVRHLATNPTDRLVVEAIVQIARGLGTRTIAEFVGDEATLALLRELGVDYAQGFHLGRPVPLAEALATSPSR